MKKKFYYLYTDNRMIELLFLTENEVAAMNDAFDTVRQYGGDIFEIEEVKDFSYFENGEKESKELNDFISER